MQRDLQIIGDRIEFYGYFVGMLCDVPATIREDFIRAITGERPLTLSQKNGRA